ncbi:hypothetical protein C8J57DRAFT_1323717 [Mycena rebaudengoi]|nr:hypothetical protein C8J57DRAFT_1323717 [Mycena rebaudengoi]
MKLLLSARRIRLPHGRSQGPILIYQRHCFRTFSTNSESTSTRRPFWIAGICLASGALAYACYDAYTTWRNLYPLEVRLDLKRGITAKRAGDPENSVYYKRKAWNTAATLPIEVFQPEPYLKITGIAVDLAGELEAEGKMDEAFGLYRDALDLISTNAEFLSERERLRAVSIAVKMGQLASSSGISVDQEEQLFVRALEELLKLLMDLQPNTTTTPSGRSYHALDFTKLHLPRWMSKSDVGVPLQELGDFYGRTGKLEYAIPLYLQGISLLASDSAGKPSAEDMCRGAQLMNNIAELVIRGDPTDERLAYSEDWARNALSILQTARKLAKEPISTCEHTLSAALYNAGILRELAGDQKQAAILFTSALEQSQTSGIEEGVQAAREAIARVDQKRTSK